MIRNLFAVAVAFAAMSVFASDAKAQTPTITNYGNNAIMAAGNEYTIDGTINNPINCVKIVMYFDIDLSDQYTTTNIQDVNDPGNWSGNVVVPSVSSDTSANLIAVAYDRDGNETGRTSIAVTLVP